jgi:hypothetical protein
MALISPEKTQEIELIVKEAYEADSLTKTRHELKGAVLVLQ